MKTYEKISPLKKPVLQISGRNGLPPLQQIQLSPAAVLLTSPVHGHPSNSAMKNISFCMSISVNSYVSFNLHRMIEECATERDQG